MTVALGSNVTSITAGGNHACALHLNGSLECWGSNSNGQLGDGTTVNRPSAVAVIGCGSGIMDVSSGSTHTCAVASNASVRCWGSNAQGQLGDGTNADKSLPVNVSLFTAP